MQLYPKAFIKSVTASDINGSVSNQHELHGVKELEGLFGVIPKGVAGTISYSATIRVGNSGPKSPINITWYNARANNPDRHEYRLYYAANGAPIVRQLSSGDDLLIGKTISGDIEIIIFPSQPGNYTNWTPITI